MSDSSTITEQHMARLWDRMAAIYGHRWTSSYGTCSSTAFSVWLRGLADIDPKQLGAGLAKCLERRDIKDAGRVDPWPPTLPEFRALCLPSPGDLGLPMEDAAYRAAANSNWSLHPAVWEAAKQVGTWELRRLPESVMRPRFITAYRSVLRAVMAGETFSAAPADMPAIELDRTPPEQRELVSAERAALAKGENPFVRMRRILAGMDQGKAA